MNNHPQFTVFPASGELGRSGFMRLSGYQHLICTAAECDLLSHQMAVSETIPRGYAWAIISLTAEVLHPINSCAPLSASTWISSDRQPINRRELQFFSGETECFRTSVFSTPVDVISHRMTRLPASDVAPASGDPLIENAVSRINDLPDMREVYRRQVFPSDIDALGHMNNCRYGALAYDALTDEERNLLGKPFRYTVNFRRQLFESSTVVVSRGEDQRGIFITGSEPDSSKPSFVVWLEM